ALGVPPRLVSRNVVPLAPSLPAARAAFAEPLACALLAIERARAEAGQTVVVVGDGRVVFLLGVVGGVRCAGVVVGASGRREVWEQAVDAVGRGGPVLFFGGCAPGTSIRLDPRRAH